jgi:4-hydroxy-tetrahydrodipicolinate synthase
MTVNLTARSLRGSICALVTPFDAHDQLDLAALTRLFATHQQAQTDALVLAGSTGESLALTEAEFTQLLHFGAENLHRSSQPSFVNVDLAGANVADVHPRLIAGTGASNTAKTIALTRLAASCGAQAALVVTPAYVRPTQEGLYQHYMHVAEAASIPIILYNVPARTAVDLQFETAARLAEHANIIGIKEALPDSDRMHALLTLQSHDFSVLSGDDAASVHAIELGARGLISVAANSHPAQVKLMVEAALAGDVANARLWRDRLSPLFEALGAEPNPIPIKWLLRELGLAGGDLRLPLTELSSAHHDNIRAIAATLATH